MTDCPEHRACLVPKDHQAKMDLLDRKVLPETLESRDQAILPHQVLPVLQEDLDLLDHLAKLELLVKMETMDHPDPQGNLDREEVPAHQDQTENPDYPEHLAQVADAVCFSIIYQY